ncbi:hypothetical protein Pcinc_001574 [Petrolisthes cinctipes]|uniref:Poly [ADP-ribose] polymerase n=1 Tax=Petrolisthes cinctipes TaxID=88211 RepID=A0AAE1GKH3_PETCI|nr:hypothetical protein Pcinc_001574 [Petrolisthes cinctipes]
MAERCDGPRFPRKEELLNTDRALNDAVRQLKAARLEDHGNEGVGRYGDGRGRRYWRGRGRGYWRGNGPYRKHEDGENEKYRGEGNERYRGRGMRWMNGGWRGGRRGRGWNRGDVGRDGFENMRSPKENYNGRGKPWAERRQEDHRKYDQDNKGHIEPSLLVKALAAQSAFSVSLLQLLEENQMSTAAVRITVSQYSNIFCLQGEEVKLQPQLNICAKYCGPQVCHNHDTCSNLHICPKLILDQCDDGSNCVLGHKWHTDHNLSILKPLLLDQLSSTSLCELLQQIYPNQCGQDLVPLSVCAAYNKDKCIRAECPDLHVCLSVVAGSSLCSQNACQLNHSIVNPSCCRILNLHGISTNNSPKDILAAMLHINPKLAEHHPQDNKKITKSEENPHKEAEVSPMKRDKTGKNKFDEGKRDESLKSEGKDSGKSRSREKINGESSSLDDDIACCDDSQRNREPIDKSFNKSIKKKVRGVPTAVQQKTQWAHYLQGDVVIPEICYDSVEGMCKQEESGCQRLHATHHFHWQVKHNKSGKWMNLRTKQVICLERAFCDPKQDGVDLPRLDPESLKKSVSDLLCLLGRDIWHAHFPDTASFTAFTLTNSSKILTLELRRLCTKVKPGQTAASTLGLNAWYFLDQNKNWVKYGRVDTLGNTHLVSNVTSNDIEMHYRYSPTAPLLIHNKYNYVLDLQTMKQANISTKVQRPVRRRPEPHLPNEQVETQVGLSKLTQAFLSSPSHWDVMPSNQTVQRVTLAPTSKEYQKIVDLLSGKMSPMVIKVERIQNPYLWRAFMNKVKEFVTKKDSKQLNCRRLFHGTKPDVVDNICAENFDWRLHGYAAGQKYGQGAYFSNNASLSFGFCRPDPCGLRYMFVVRVMVGSYTVGDSSMVRPPINPVTSTLYDSTVDNLRRPSIFVKYEKQEYYPEYIITMGKECVSYTNVYGPVLKLFEDLL